MTTLLDAIRQDDNALLRQLIDAGADVNVGEFYMTPLQMAIMKDNKDAFNILIQAGADVNKPEETKGWRPVTYAAKNGNLEMLEELLDRGADVNVQDSDGRTLLEFAVRGKHEEAVRCLIERGADTRSENIAGRTKGLMYTAMMTGCVEVVARLRVCGLNFETIHPEQKEPGIFRLVQFNILEMVGTVIPLGADVNIENMWGETPLFRCSDFGASVASIHLLMKGGADVNHLNNMGETAIVRCVTNGHFDKVKALLDWGANVDYCSPGKQSLVTMAVERGYSNIVKLLVCAGCRGYQQEDWLRGKLPDHLHRHITTVNWLREQAQVPFSLKWYSRLVIRHGLQGHTTAQIGKLPLPSLLKDFLCLPTSTDLGLNKISGQLKQEMA